MGDELDEFDTAYLGGFYGWQESIGDFLTTAAFGCLLFLLFAGALGAGCLRWTAYYKILTDEDAEEQSREYHRDRDLPAYVTLPDNDEE